MSEERAKGRNVRVQDKRDFKSKEQRRKEEKEKLLAEWVPKTSLGKKVKTGEIDTLASIFEKGFKILEPEIVDSLEEFEENVIDIKKTTHVVRAGRKFAFRATVIVGNKKGIIGVGTGNDIDKFPAINKATRSAKLNLKRIYLGSGSWEEQSTTDKHSVPFKVEGKCAGVRVILLPAPKGTGLAIGKTIKPIMELAGVQNVWGKTRGSSDTRLNYVRAAITALENTGKMKATKEIEEKLNK